jgi:anti-anti-sigma regulatory factor
MGIKNVSEDILLVNLPPKQPHIGDELKHLNEMVITDSDCDVVIDFSEVEIINSSDLSNLLTLRALLREHGRKLVLSNVTVLTKGIFTVAGLDAVFEFAADRKDGLAVVQHSKHTPSQ